MFAKRANSKFQAILLSVRTLNNPIWPDAQPRDNLFIVICAIIIVWMKRRKMFQLGTGLTDILMPEKDTE